jgi:hypothetical protein
MYLRLLLLLLLAVTSFSASAQKYLEMIEIKPRKQSLIEERQSQRERAQVAINHAKWDQAVKWCRRNGLTFRVITEDQIFHKPGR